MNKWMRILPCIFLGALVVFAAVVALIKPLAADPIRDAENWFNRITTMKARFIQTSDDGSSAMGDFYMRRPHRARFDYDDPIDIVLITTEVWLHIDEPSRRTVTSYPISETPLKILFSEKVRLHHEGITTTATSDDGVLSVRLAKPTGHDAGVILLEFTEKPFALRRWTITDSTGLTTRVTFQNIEMGMPLPARLFVPTNYPAPSGGGGGSN